MSLLNVVVLYFSIMFLKVCKSFTYDMFEEVIVVSMMQSLEVHPLLLLQAFPSHFEINDLFCTIDVILLCFHLGVCKNHQ